MKTHRLFKYEVELELVESPLYAGCQCCFFEYEDLCPCEECNLNKIFVMKDFKQVEEIQDEPV